MTITNIYTYGYNLTRIDAEMRFAHDAGLDVNDGAISFVAQLYMLTIHQTVLTFKCNEFNISQYLSLES